MQCAACGAELTAESSFCAKCGERIGDAPESGGAPAKPIDKFREMADAKTGDDHDDEEEDLWEGGYSGKAMIGSWIGGLLATVALLIVTVMTQMWFLLIPIAILWGVLGCMLVYRKLSVHYQLTTQRFIHKLGILKRTTDRIEVIDIDDVTFEQGIVERLVGVGTIHISSSDRTHPELLLRGIDDVQRIADTIDDVRRKERRKRGLHIEAI